MTETYALIEVALIEPNSATVRNMREALGQLGIRNIRNCSDISVLSETTGGSFPDLVIVDVDSPAVEGLKVIQLLRTDSALPNPFVSVIACAEQPSASLRHKVDNSGADALLVKPFTRKHLVDMVQGLIAGRRPFVVSTDYIGPDRRKNPRDDTKVAVLAVPNTLRAKATGHWSLKEAQERIAAGVSWLSERKAQSDSFQVAFLLE